MLNQQNRFEWK